VKDLVVKIARHHVQANDWSAALSLLERVMTSGVSSPEILYLQGYAFFRQGKDSQAQAYLDQAVAGFKRDDPSAREAAAAAQFYLGELAYRDFLSFQLSSDLSQLGPTLQQKLQLVAQTSAAYMNVVKSGSPFWSVAALSRLGAVDAAGAEALRTLGLPQGLSPGVVKKVKKALEAKAVPLARESWKAIKQCAATARRFKVLSEAARACLSGRASVHDPQSSAAPPAVLRTKPREAVVLERTLAKKPRDLPSIIKLSELYLRAGDPYLARLVLGKGLEIEETAAVLNLLGVASAKLGEHQTALRLFNKALDKEPTNEFLHQNKATLYARFGYTRASRAELEMIQRKEPLKRGDPRLLSGAGGGR